MDFLLIAKAITDEQQRQLASGEPVNLDRLEAAGLQALLKQEREDVHDAE